MNNTKLILIALLISTISFAQINITGTIKENALNARSPFLDAASNGSSADNQGKGLLFPRTDLTSFTTMSPTSNSASFYPTSNPNGFDGMIVYNVGTGTSAMGGSVQVTPGYYYYKNTTGDDNVRSTNDINGGTWIRISDAASVASSLFENDNTNSLVKLSNLSDAKTVRPTGTEFIIKDDGKVGIGVADPQEALDIAGNIKLTDTITASRAVINSLRIPNSMAVKDYVLSTDEFGNISWTAGPSATNNANDHIGNKDLALTNDRILTTTDKNLKFEGTATGGDVDIKEGVVTAVSLATTNLRVGITNTANQVLVADATDGTVKWGDAPKASLFDNDNTKTQVKLSNLSDGKTVRPTGAEFVIQDDGKVGVGTADPKQNLDVVGNIKAADTVITKHIKITGGSPSSGHVLVSDADGNATWKDIKQENYIKDITINFSSVNAGPVIFDNTKILKADGNLYANQNEWEVEEFTPNTSQQGLTLNQATSFGIAASTNATVKIQHTGTNPTSGFSGIRAITRDDATTLRINSITITYTGNSPDDLIIYGRNYTSPAANVAVDMKTTDIATEDNLVKFIDGSNTADAVYTSGKVGIGLLDPKKRLEVSGGSIRTSDTLFVKNIQLLTDNTPVKDQILTVLDAQGNVGWKTATTAPAGWELKGNTGTDITTDFIGTTDDKELNIRTNNVERVKVTTDNRFLLNVVSAWSPFTPGSSNTIGLNTAGANNQRLRLTTGSQDTQNGTQGASIDLFGNNTLINAGRLDLVPGSSAAAGAPAINFYGNDGTSQVQAMTMLGNGNLGIGFVPAAPPSTPSQPHMPTEKLDVLGNIKSSDTLITTGIKITGGTMPPTDGQVLTAVGTTGKGQWSNAVRNIFKDQDLGLITKWSGKLVNGQRSSGSKTSANTFLGIDNGTQITTGELNTVVGANALQSNTTGKSNTVIGAYALQDNNTGSSNISVGNASMIENTTGSNNISMGAELKNTNNNIAVGIESIVSVKGDDNIGLGYFAGLENENGIGTGVFNNTIQIGSKSVYIGNNTKGLNNATNQIVIGSEAIGKGSNSVVLGNEKIRNTLLRGVVHLDTIALSTPPTDGYQLTADGTSGKVKWSIDPVLFQRVPTKEYVEQKFNSASNTPSRSFIIHDQGYVGIGGADMTNTIQTLNIGTKTTATDADGLLMTNSTNDSIAYLHEGKGNLGGTLNLYGQKVLKIKIAGPDDTNSYINNGGDLGIGTSAPKEKLDVVGKIQVTDTLKTKYFNLPSASAGLNQLLTSIDDKGNAIWKDLLADENDIKTIEIVYGGATSGWTFSNLKILGADGDPYEHQSDWTVTVSTKNASQVNLTLDQVTNFGTGPTNSTFIVKVEHKAGVPTVGFAGFRAQLRHNSAAFGPKSIKITYTGSLPDYVYTFPSSARYANASGLNYNDILIPNTIIEASITKFVDGTDPKDAVYVNNVGIGTYTPTQKLDVVNGSIKTSDTLIGRYIKINTAPKAGQLLTTTGTTGEAVWQDLKGVFSNNTSGKRIEVRSQSDNVSTRAAGTEFIIQDTGRVGIGKTNPSRLLDVEGNMKVRDTIETSRIKITGGSPGLGKVLTSDSDGNAVWSNSLVDNTDIASINIQYGSKSGSITLQNIKVFSANGSLYSDQSLWKITSAPSKTSEVNKTLDQSTNFNGANGTSGTIEIEYTGTDRTIGFGGIKILTDRRGTLTIPLMTVRYKGGAIPDTSLPIPDRGNVNNPSGTGPLTVDVPVSLSTAEITIGNGISKFVDGTNAADAVYNYGRVGIGTYDPTAALDVEGDTRVGTTLKVGERMGIGTTDPKAPLHVAASQNYADEVYDASFIDKAATGLQEDQGTASAKLTMDISAYFASNVISDQKIISASADSFSDERIKDIVSISDPEEDLELLDKIKITNYTKKDTLALGKKMSKKVIAQQVEKVFPQVVSKMRRAIPDIYKSTAQLSYANNQLTISCPQDLKTGDKVKVMVFVKGKKGSKALTAPVVSADTNSFVININQAIKGEIKSVFVYGREVDDFRTVDYEGISMLNVSATQALYKRIKQLKEDRKQIRAQIETLKGKAFSKEEKKHLRSMIEAFDHSSQMSSKK